MFIPRVKRKQRFRLTAGKVSFPVDTFRLCTYASKGIEFVSSAIRIHFVLQEFLYSLLLSMCITLTISRWVSCSICTHNYRDWRKGVWAIREIAGDKVCCRSRTFVYASPIPQILEIVKVRLLSPLQQMDTIPECSSRHRLIRAQIQCSRRVRVQSMSCICIPSPWDNPRDYDNIAIAAATISSFAKERPKKVRLYSRNRLFSKFSLVTLITIIISVYGICAKLIVA